MYYIKGVITMTTKTSDTAIREMLEKALNVYDMPEIGIKIALAYIDGLKTGSALPPAPPEAQNATRRQCERR